MGQDPSYKSRGVFTSMAVLVVCGVFGAMTGGCFLGPEAEPRCPGEIPHELAEGMDRIRGDYSPFSRSFAVVVNERGQYLLSLCLRPDPMPEAIHMRHPSGGERPVAMEDRTMIVLWVKDHVDSDSGMSYSRIYRECFRTTRVGMTLLDGLWWTIPGGDRVGDESAWDAALRAIAEETAAPAKYLEQECVYFDDMTRTAYFRVLYTRASGDQFLVRDPDKYSGKLFHSEAIWLDPDEAPVQAIIAYLMFVDGIGSEGKKALFGSD